MKQFISFVKKEFYHILRDKKTFFILLGMPVIQIIIFGFALTNEVKNAKIAVLDQSKDISTLRLTEQINSSKYFDLVRSLNTPKEIERTCRSPVLPYDPT